MRSQNSDHFPKNPGFALLFQKMTAVSEFGAMSLVGCDLIHSVDGSEIRRAPVEVGIWIIPIFRRVLYIPGGT